MTVAERYICIHGHFYQPPRENPWLEVVELQDSAFPYHDWNERVTAECYAPNARSRILDEQGRIVEIVNNYSRISFDFGPTLLKWMQDERPDVYEAVLAADASSMRRFGGHGSALAQAWGHMIMPLANRRDKRTQIVWGILDFEHRFQRFPEGMWLPETAVDIETLELMAEHGIRFTILAPHQALRVRPLEGGEWADVSGGRVDPSRPYLVRLPSGRAINVFFYDGAISRAVAFEGLLSSGQAFAERLAAAAPDGGEPRLVNIATDGESYGHHHRHGDMALAYAVHRIETGGLGRLTNYGEFLEQHPPQYEVEVLENSSWSCGHGVERWRADCGCSTGKNPGWNQAWRGPLREAMDWLRDSVAPAWEKKASEIFADPWAARDSYIDVILDRTAGGVDRFLRQYALRPLDAGERVTALKLMELQRHAMLMYTSCGWFFDDVSGIETAQVIQYAGRLVQLAQELFGDHLEEGFLSRLALARSNVPQVGDARAVYQQVAKPAAVDLLRIGAHLAISSLFESYPKESRLFCYDVQIEEFQIAEAGAAKLALGHAGLTSAITGESGQIAFGVLHFGDHNLTAGVRPFQGPEAYASMVQDVAEAFARADLPDVIRRLDRHFGELTYSIKSLFRDEQRKVLDIILRSTLAEVEAVYRQVHEHHAPLMRFLLDLGAPMPDAFRAAAELVINGNLRRALEDAAPDPSRVRALLDEARLWGVVLDGVGLGYTFQRTLEAIASRLGERRDGVSTIQRLSEAVTLARELPFPVDLWGVQNYYWESLQRDYPAYRERAQAGDSAAGAWLAAFSALGELLSVRVPS